MREDGTAQRQDVADRREIEGNGVDVEYALPAATQADDLPAVFADASVYHRPYDGVEPGTVTASRKDAYLHDRDLSSQPVVAVCLGWTLPIHTISYPTGEAPTRACGAPPGCARLP